MKSKSYLIWNITVGTFNFDVMLGKFSRLLIFSFSDVPEI